MLPIEKSEDELCDLKLGQDSMMNPIWHDRGDDREATSQTVIVNRIFSLRIVGVCEQGYIVSAV
jgi:hypothetical protein